MNTKPFNLLNPRMAVPQSGIQTQDRILVERLKEGEPGAIDEIVEKYKRPLFAFILRMIDNHATAEDIFQETWLRVIRHIRGFRGDSRFSTWLFQIALNLCRNAIRKKSRRFVPLEEAESIAVEPRVDAERIFEAERVRKVVASLPRKMREVIVLRYYHDLSEMEISEIVGSPVGTIKSRIYRAHIIIRQKMET